jgi:hypothetical protein
MSSAQKIDQLLFRCSRLGDLVTGGEGITANQLARLEELQLKNSSGKITEKQLIDLGSLLEKKIAPITITQTTKSYVETMWLEKEFGFKKDVLTDEMLKGLLCEQDSVGLVKKVLGGEFRIKNTQRFRNEFIEGTPDVILKKEDFIEDVKSSFDLSTFVGSSLTSGYEWQGQGYMWLTGKTKYRLIYCLVKTPEEIIIEQKKKWYFKFNCDENNPHYQSACIQIDHNNDLIDHLPLEKRIRVFEFAFDPQKIELLKKKIIASREYYKTLKL